MSGALKTRNDLDSRTIDRFMSMFAALERDMVPGNLNKAVLYRQENMIEFARRILEIGEWIRKLKMNLRVSVSDEQNPNLSPMLREILQRYFKPDPRGFVDLRLVLIEEETFLIGWIEENRKDASQLMMEQFHCELKRLNLKLNVFRSVWFGPLCIFLL
ncbi:MAG: hypothetical protein GY696_11745 [Gammaproteobacteria bacterium]|nr:hypothetical protein [Gammaproteobacteria bacterium]